MIRYIYKPQPPPRIRTPINLHTLQFSSSASWFAARQLVAKPSHGAHTHYKHSKPGLGPGVCYRASFSSGGSCLYPKMLMLVLPPGGCTITLPPNWPFWPGMKGAGMCGDVPPYSAALFPLGELAPP